MAAATFLNNTIQFFINGGLFMGILMIVSVVAVTVIILRGMALNVKNVIPPQLSDEVERLQPGDSLKELHELVDAYPSALGRVLNTLLNHLAWPRAEVVEAVQTTARREVSRLEKGLVILEIVTGIGPLLGLLGTLSGLVTIFGAVGSDPSAVARGIAEALNSTIVGLAVAVPCLVTYNYFQRRVEVMAIEMESIVSDLIAKCYPSTSFTAE